MLFRPFLFRFVPSVGTWSHLTESGMDRPQPPDSGPVSAKITLEWQMRLCVEPSRHAARFEAFHRKQRDDSDENKRKHDHIDHIPTKIDQNPTR